LNPLIASTSDFETHERIFICLRASRRRISINFTDGVALVNDRQAISLLSRANKVVVHLSPRSVSLTRMSFIRSSPLLHLLDLDSLPFRKMFDRRSHSLGNSGHSRRRLINGKLLLMMISFELNSSFSTSLVACLMQSYGIHNNQR
jgi:hypothetical protein